MYKVAYLCIDGETHIKPMIVDCKGLIDAIQFFAESHFNKNIPLAIYDMGGMIIYKDGGLSFGTIINYLEKIYNLSCTGFSLRTLDFVREYKKIKAECRPEIEGTGNV